MRFIAALALLALLPQEPPRFAERWVAAFYRAAWDAESGEGLTRSGGGDALQDHPESFTDFSWKKAGWHRANLEGMGEASIDVALCEFAANTEAVDALVQALEAASHERKKIPRVAPAVADPDAARAFLKKVPERFLAASGGRFLAWLPPSKHAKPGAFAEDSVFTAGDPAWKPHVEAATGGAHDGPRESGAITIGPGYKDGSPRFRARDDGVWYERSWYIALKIRPKIIAIESWNRFDEGSTICPTREHGAALVAKTRKYGDQFRKGDEIPRPKGRYSAAPGVSYHLKFDPPEAGLRLIEGPDSPFEVVTLAGQKLLMVKAVPGKETRILAFDIDDSYALYERREHEIQLMLMDRGRGQVTLEYDAAVPGASGPDRTVRAAEPFYFTDSGEWTTAHFKLPDAAFANRQEGGSDFRLVLKGRGLSLKWIQLRAK